MSESSAAFLGYNDAEHYARKVANEIYPQGCDKIKMGKKVTTRAIKMGHLSGEADAAMDILNRVISLGTEPFDVVIGELQLIAAEKWNNLRDELTKNGNRTSMSPAGIDAIAEVTQLALDKVNEEKEQERLEQEERDRKADEEALERIEANELEEKYDERNDMAGDAEEAECFQ